MRPHRRGHGAPIDWEAEARRPKPVIVLVGVAILLLGLAVLAGSFFIWDFLDWWDGNVFVAGDPTMPFRIVGGIFSLLGVFVIWVGIPHRP